MIILLISQFVYPFITVLKNINNKAMAKHPFFAFHYFTIVHIMNDLFSFSSEDVNK